VSFIVDSSVALSWCFEDERTPATAALLQRVGETGAVAPQRWPLEALNGLMMAERRNRLDTERRRRFARLLRDLPITLDPETSVRVWTTTQDLAERFRLTVYDAAYLELAQRQNLPLASLDGDLRAAGTVVSVPLLGTEP
jgi:predicted nucleic acid-binding protein